jgi:hypothetical protein
MCSVNTQKGPFPQDQVMAFFGHFHLLALLDWNPLWDSGLPEETARS